MVLENVFSIGSCPIMWTGVHSHSAMRHHSVLKRSMTTEDAEDEYHKCFSFFDKQNLGYIDVPTFVIALRALGQEFTDEELDLLLQHSKFENDEYDKITYKEFVKMMMAQ